MEFDQFYIEIAIVNSDTSLDFESDRNRRSKAAGLESESLTIRFVSQKITSKPENPKMQNF